MQVYRTKSFDELVVSADDWNRLSGGVPFRSFEWLVTWWRHFQPAMTAAGRQVELYTLQVTDGNELIGLAPWYVDRSRAAGSIVRFLGSGEVCSDYLSVLCRPDRRTVVAEKVAAWLTQNRSATGATDDHWDVLEWSNVDAVDEMSDVLGDQLRQRGAEVFTSSAVNTWRIELPETVEEYLNLLS